MSEVEVASVYTHLLILDAVKLMWIPVSQEYIHVVLLYDQRSHSYRYPSIDSFNIVMIIYPFI